MESVINQSTNHSVANVDSQAERERARALALRIAEIISDSPATNTVVIDVNGLSSFADYFVICSGENERQLQAISARISEGMAEDGVRSKRAEGSAQAGWILLDFADVIVHIFDVEQRAFYRLEALWSDAPTVLSIQ